jgi:phosphoglycolate phosphatase-like HAD superfamily hydrolase
MTRRVSLKDKRLYLFDIDGTLITTGGAGSAAMRSAFASIYGLDDAFKSIEFSGRSDFAIFEDALRHAGVSDEEFAEAMRKFKRVYYRHLPASLKKYEGRVLPGVVAVLDELARESNATLALGTGNFRNSAGMKLKHYGIAQYFRGGGFGDRTGHRPTLIAQGIASANRAHGKHATVFVIGDTVHDVSAAKANNAVAVAVATGTASQDELIAAGADVVLPTMETAMQFFSS